MDVYLAVYPGNSLRVEVRGLSVYVGVEDTLYDNAATVTARLVDGLGAEIPGQTWPLALTYEAGSDGNYSGVVGPSLVVKPGDVLYAEVTAISGADQGFWRSPCMVDWRTHRSGYG